MTKKANPIVIMKTNPLVILFLQCMVQNDLLEYGLFIELLKKIEWNAPKNWLRYVKHWPKSVKNTSNIVIKERNAQFSTK